MWIWKRIKESGKTPPKDPSGRVLDGLHDLEVGDEGWMHVAPKRDELARHGPRLGRVLESHQGMVDDTSPRGRRGGDQEKVHRGLEQDTWKEFDHMLEAGHCS